MPDVAVDLFQEIEDRLEAFDLYERIRRRRPWRWIPGRLRARLVGFLVKREILHG